MTYSTIPNPMRQLIGEIIVQWGMIENIMFSDLLIYAMIKDVNEAGICKPIPRAAKQRVRLWKKAQAMAWEATNFSLKDLDRSSIFQKISDHLEKRNHIAHSMWIGDTDSDGRILARAFDVRSQSFKDVRYSQRYLDDLCLDIAATEHILRDDSLAFFKFLPKMSEHFVSGCSLDDLLRGGRHQ